VHNKQPSCFYARRPAGRTAKSTAIGALSRHLSDGRVLQRHVLYLGEINASQELAWRKSIEVFEDGAEVARARAIPRRSL
jgi:hypothetical protein